MYRPAAYVDAQLGIAVAFAGSRQYSNSSRSRVPVPSRLRPSYR
jgi:hypothetical protein